jgi:hypothetical protein
MDNSRRVLHSNARAGAKTGLDIWIEIRQALQLQFSLLAELFTEKMLVKF